MPVKVELRPRDISLARRLMAGRSESFEDADEWYDEDKAQSRGREQKLNHFFGVLGELAFSKYYGPQIDTQTYTRTDGGLDFRVRIDTKNFDNEIVGVDVKASPVNSPQLMITEGKVEADYYVQCKAPQQALETQELVTIKMLGGATKEMVLNREPIQSLKYDDSYHAVSSEYLLELPSPEDVHPVE